MFRTTFRAIASLALTLPALAGVDALAQRGDGAAEHTLLPVVPRVTETLIRIPPGEDDFVGPGRPSPRPPAPRPTPRPTTPSPPPPPREQAPGDRMLFFAHGLGGARSAWGPVAAELQREYETRNQLLQYSDLKDRDLPGLASHVYNTLPAPSALWDDYRADPARTMYISHSMGGLIGYEMLRFQEETDETLETLKYRGIVTVNTPFGGARQTADEGKEQVVDLMQEGCVALTEGPIKAATAGLPWFLKLKTYENEDDLLPNGKEPIFELTDDFVRDGCLGGVFEGILNFVVVDKTLPDVAEEMDPDGAYLAGLADYEPIWDIPAARITSYEEQPVTLRLASSGINDPAKQTVYTANDDLAFRDTLDSWVAKYQLGAARQHAEALRLEQKCAKAGFVGCLLNGNKGRAEEKREAAGYYEEGVAWLENLNDAWLGIIGALEYETVDQSYRCDCEYYDYGEVVGGYDYETETAEECEREHDPDEVCEATLLFRDQRAIYYPSDGAALLSSQTARGAEITRNYEDSNHLQIRNDKNTQDAFENVLFGSEDEFFHTDLRNP